LSAPQIWKEIIKYKQKRKPRQGNDTLKFSISGQGCKKSVKNGQGIDENKKRQACCSRCNRNKGYPPAYIRKFLKKGCFERRYPGNSIAGVPDRAEINTEETLFKKCCGQNCDSGSVKENKTFEGQHRIKHDKGTEPQIKTGEYSPPQWKGKQYGKEG
jgi:hypothetical protein